VRIGGIGWKGTGIWVLLSVAFSYVHAAFEGGAVDTRSIAMGVSGVACPGLASGVFVNPSRAASIQNLSVSVGFSPAPFDLPELQTGSAAVVVPFSFGSLFVGAAYSGFRLYREHTFRLGAGSSLSDNLDVGVCLTYYSLGIDRYGNDGTLGLDLGVCVHLGTTLTLGFTALNFTGASIGDFADEIPQVFTIGLSFLATDELAIAADVTKDLHFPAETGVGVEYTSFRVLHLRAGISDSPSTMNAGIGLTTEILQVEYGVRIHPVLGPTHQIGVILLPGAW
jgi:hypothetical protein